MDSYDAIIDCHVRTVPIRHALAAIREYESRRRNSGNLVRLFAQL